MAPPTGADARPAESGQGTQTFHRRKVARAYPTNPLGNFCRLLALSTPEC